MSKQRDALLVARNSDGAAIKRPLSPHLQVYRPQMTTVLSITHRATGIALSAGTLLMAWWLVALAGPPIGFARVQVFAGSWPGLVMLFGWTAALFYHFLAGLRHLAWDAGFGFELKTARATGWAVLAGAVLLTGATWAAGWMIWRGGLA